MVFQVCGFDVSAEISAIHLCHFAVAADHAAFELAAIASRNLCSNTKAHL